MAFETPNLEPANVPEAWAPERAPAGSGANVKPNTERPSFEAIEDQAWQYDPGATPDDEPQAAPDPAEVPPEPQVEHEAEPAEEIETKPEPEAQQPRAQQRIQQLANEKRELQQHLERMEKLFERQTKADEQRAEQERQYALRQQQFEIAERERAAKALYDQHLIANGQDPNAPHNQASWAALQQTGQLNQELTALKQQQAQAAEQIAVNNYVNAMNANVDEVLAEYEVSKKQIAAVKKNAYALARAQQIANPHDAVRQALEAYSDDNGQIMLPKKGAKPAPKTQTKTQPVDAMIAQRGSRGDAEKGQLANGKKPKRSIEQIEKDWGAGGWR